VQGEQESKALDHPPLVRACDYATGIFRARMTEIENLRNRSVVSLGLISASSALLTLTGAIERLGSLMWVPALLLGAALALSLPPLMSVSIVYPVDLKSFKNAVETSDPHEVDHAVLNNTVAADEKAERLARATALFTNNALRLAALGLSTLTVAVVFTDLEPIGGVLTGFVVGVLLLAVVEWWRYAMKMGLET